MAYAVTTRALPGRRSEMGDMLACDFDRNPRALPGKRSEMIVLA